MMTSKRKILVALMAITMPFVLGFADGALAASKKKLTYEEAYAKCKAIMDKEGTPGTTTQSNVRYTRGAACMKKYGHKL
jgi:hypothetical protein